ncbi:MAG: hypothetical protein RLQ12_13665 [Cyclobacteriaceae bacterium]
MIDQENLRYFITEEIFLVEETQDHQLKSVEEQPQKPAPSKIHDVVVWTHELTDKDQMLLTKMLEAVKLDISKVHLIHHEQEYTDSFKTLLSFGHTSFLAEKVEKEIILNEPLQTGSKSILVSYPISSLHEDVKKKAALWNGLKKLFH